MILQFHRFIFLFLNIKGILFAWFFLFLSYDSLFTVQYPYCDTNTASTKINITKS